LVVVLLLYSCLFAFFNHISTAHGRTHANDSAWWEHGPPGSLPLALPEDLGKIVWVGGCARERMKCMKFVSFLQCIVGRETSETHWKKIVFNSYVS